MFVHVKYVNVCRDRIMEFNNNQYITVNDIIEKVRHTYGECTTLQLLNEHGREFKVARNSGKCHYIYKEATKMNGGLSVYIPRILQFTLFYNETLNRMDVVPGRALHDFYRRSRCKRKRDGTLVKPSSLTPTPPYTLPQLNTHEYLYTSVAAITVDGCAVPAYSNQG